MNTDPHIAQRRREFVFAGGLVYLAICAALAGSESSQRDPWFVHLGTWLLLGCYILLGALAVAYGLYRLALWMVGDGLQSKESAFNTPGAMVRVFATAGVIAFLALDAILAQRYSIKNLVMREAVIRFSLASHLLFDALNLFLINLLACIGFGCGIALARGGKSFFRWLAGNHDDGASHAEAANLPQPLPPQG